MRRSILGPTQPPLRNVAVGVVIALGLVASIATSGYKTQRLTTEAVTLPLTDLESQYRRPRTLLPSLAAPPGRPGPHVCAPDHER